MKRIPVTLGALSLLLLLTVASCASTLSDEPTTDACAISFMPAAETRAAVTGTSLPGGSSISVWGWYGTEGTITNNVFDCETVTESGGAWTYGGGSRYWIAGETYNFYAVYPSSGDNAGYKSASYDESGNLTITNFDCTQGVDLMTASREGCVADEMIASGNPVAFTFEHLLARVEFVVKRHSASVDINNFSPSVNSAKLYGMYATGDFDATGWKLPGNNVENRTDVNNPLVSMNDSKAVNNDPVTLLDVMLCPQTIEREFNFSIGFRTTDTGSYTNQTINLTTINLTKWEAGKHYRYTFTITPDDRILVEIPTVSEWGNASGGIIIVD